jgi:hypothetical protein
MSQTAEEQEKAKQNLLNTIKSISSAYERCGGPFFFGAKPSYADFHWFPWVHRLGVLKHYRDFSVPETPEYAGAPPPIHPPLPSPSNVFPPLPPPPPSLPPCRCSHLCPAQRAAERQAHRVLRRRVQGLRQPQQVTRLTRCRRVRLCSMSVYVCE